MKSILENDVLTIFCEGRIYSACSNHVNDQRILVDFRKKLL